MHEEDELARSISEMYGDGALTMCRQYAGKLRQDKAFEDLQTRTGVMERVSQALKPPA